jgi:biopolymer transport protein ExbB/TolQ
MNIVTQGKALMLAMGASPVMYLMIALSIVSLGIALERAIYLFRRSDDVEALAQKLEAHLKEGDVVGAMVRLRQSPAPEAHVVLAGLAKVEGGPRAASEAMTAASTVERMKLERGLAFLGTLGNNAPFLGLFGTVIGIIMAFEQLGRGGMTSGAGAPTEVMSSIAEALVATAVGLAVAIPSVALNNYFQRRIKTTLSSTSALSHVLLAWIEVAEHATVRASAGAGA